MKVSKRELSESVDYIIEFLTDLAPVQYLRVHHSFQMAESSYCICVNSSMPCSSGLFEIGCHSSGIQKGTLSASRMKLNAKNIVSSESNFAHNIPNLSQSSDVSSEFGIQISAGNSRAYGIPCPVNLIKPVDVPEAPEHVELTRDFMDPSKLIVYFNMVSFPQDKGDKVHSFSIEWKKINEQSYHHLIVPTGSLESSRLPTYHKAGARFLQHTITNLISGVGYIVRVASINSVGKGESRSSPSSLSPGSKPKSINKNDVVLSTIHNDATTSVLESSTSLLVTWLAPPSDNGYSISKYIVEYWISNDSDNDLQEIVLLSQNKEPRGTFTLSYDDTKTEALSASISSFELQVALESLPSVRSVYVEQVKGISNTTWRVTFNSMTPLVGKLLIEVHSDTELMDISSVEPQMTVHVVSKGSLPSNYRSIEHIVLDNNKSVFTDKLTNLTTDQDYFVQVSAFNFLGYSSPRASVPIFL